MKTLRWEDREGIGGLVDGSHTDLPHELQRRVFLVSLRALHQRSPEQVNCKCCDRRDDKTKGPSWLGYPPQQTGL